MRAMTRRVGDTPDTAYCGECKDLALIRFVQEDASMPGEYGSPPGTRRWRVTLLCGHSTNVVSYAQENPP